MASRRQVALIRVHKMSALGFVALLTVAGLAVLMPVADAAAPSISTVAPTSGLTNGGYRVTITGANFEDGATVEVGDGTELGTNPASPLLRGQDVIVASPTSLSFIMPPHKEGGVGFRVTNPGGEATTFTGLFTYNRPAAAITVDAVNPTTGSPAGGSLVTIQGTNFDVNSRPKVTFDGIAGTVLAVTATGISVLTPAHVPGNVADLAVAFPGLTADLDGADNLYAANRPNLFSFDAGTRPTVSGLSTATGPVTGGTLVTINGANFVPGVQVVFSIPTPVAGTIESYDMSTEAERAQFSPRVVFSSATQITAVAPAQPATTYYVRVIHPGALGANGLVTESGLANLVSTAVVPFTMTEVTGSQVPTLSAVSPNAGPTVGGTLVTLTGTNFHTGANEKPRVQVRLQNAGACGASTGLANVKDVPADDVTVLGATSLQVRMPDFPSNALADILVANPGVSLANGVASPAGAACLSDAFRYGFAGIGNGGTVQITSLSQTQGSAAGGANLNGDGLGEITVTGGTFESGVQVFFGSYRAAVVTRTDASNLQVRPPPQPPGTVHVAVLNPDGRAGVFFGYTYSQAPAPGFDDVDGTAGSNGGDLITLKGSGFQFSGDPDGVDGPLLPRVPIVTVGGTQAEVVTVGSGVLSQFDILAPVRPMTVDNEQIPITITNPDGRSVTSNDNSPSGGGNPVTNVDYVSYTEDPAPALSVVYGQGSTTPATGRTFGGTPILITGVRGDPGGPLPVDDVEGASSNFFIPPTEDWPEPTVFVGGVQVPRDGVIPVASGADSPFGLPDCPAATDGGPCLAVMTPPKAGSGDAAANNKVRVVHPDGQSDESDNPDNNDDFDYVATSAPAATGVAGGPASTMGGTMVRITGTNFGPVTKDSSLANLSCTTTGANAPMVAGGFNGYTAASPLPTVTFDGVLGRVLCVEDNVAGGQGETIHVLAPPNSAGPATIVVRNPDGQSSTLAGTLNYDNAPAPTLNPPAQQILLTPIGGQLVDSIPSTPGVVDAFTGTAIGPTTLDAEGRACNVAGFDKEEVVTPVPLVTIGGVPALDVCAVFDTNGATAGTPSSLTFRTTYSPPAAFPTPGVKTLLIQNPDNQGATLGGQLRVLNFVPTPTSITPSTASANGGAQLTVRGSSFPTDPKPSILVGATDHPAPAFAPALAVGATTATSAVFTMPPRSPAVLPSVLDVQAIDGDGQAGLLDGQLTITPARPPQLKSITPSAGTLNGGTPVTIDGHGFAGGADVVFGGKTITSTTVSPDGKRLTFVTPNFMELAPAERRLGPVDLFVFNPLAGVDADPFCPDPTGGITTADNHCLDLTGRFSFSTAVGPTVSSVSPSSGPAAGGTAVTITGSNFVAGATVKFGDADATDVVVTNGNTITAKTPPGTGAVAVSVTSAGITASLANGFTYIGDASSSTTSTGPSPTTSPTSTRSPTSTTSPTAPTGTNGLTPPTLDEIEDANDGIELRVTREGDTNVLEWDLPPASQRPALPIAGVQVWFSNSPYTLLDTFPAGSDEFEDGAFTHTGPEARASTKYLVTMYYGATSALGFFSGGSAPDTEDYPGLASTDEQPGEGGDGGLPTWAIVLIVLGILFLVVLVAVLIARGRSDDGQQTQQVYQEPPPGAPPVESGEVHQARCPACATSFTVTGTKPVITVCPGCGKKGILR